MIFNQTLSAMVFAGIALTGHLLFAQNKIGDICGIKGQERNVLRGVGLVVGLQGTGDANLETTGAALAEALTKSGMEIPRDGTGRPITEVYKDNKNATLVFVTAEVPPAGARQGSLINCQVHAWGKTSSLAGGMLLETALTGGPVLEQYSRGNGAGRASSLPVLAQATGKIRIEGSVTNSGRIDNGCQMQVDFNNKFYEEVTEFIQTVNDYGTPVTEEQKTRFVNLVVKPGHASFATASKIAEHINNEINLNRTGGMSQTQEDFAIAMDQVTIRVKITPEYTETPVDFVRFLLEDITVLLNNKSSSIVINRSTGVISVGEDVYFSPVAISSGEFNVDIAPFKELSLEDNQGLGNGLMKLKRLTDALNDIQAPASTVIDIIKHLEVGGHLYGKVIEL